MNILFFARLYYPHIGGVEKHVAKISEQLIENGHTITVVTEKFDKSLTDKEVHNGVTIYRMPVSESWFKKFQIWLFLFKNINLLKKADIIHCHDVFFWYIPFRFLFLTKKIFTTFHGYEGNAEPTRKAILMHKLAEVFSRGTICIGEFQKKWYGTKPTIVSFGAIDPDAISDSPPTFRNPLRAVFVGRLVEETGIMTYLRALKILKENGQNIRLQVLGDGVLRVNCERFVKENRLSVEFLGFVPSVSAFLKKADFAFVSRYLGMLEAFAAKRLVFAVYTNTIKEDYLRMSPFADWISICKDEYELARDVQFFIGNKKLIYQKTQKAHSWVKSQTWNHLAENYLHLWRKR